MRLMEMIRRKGQAFLTGFLVIFLIATFAGLGVGFFNIQLGSGGARGGQPKKSGKLAKLPAMEVNGRKVSEADLNEVLDTVFREAASRASDDPSVALDAYGYVTELMVYQETMLGKAEELDVKVSSEDIAKAKEKDSQSFVAQEEKPASTIVGELGQKLSKVREKNAGFQEYLARSGMTEELWMARTRKQLMIENTRQKLQDAADAKKKAKAEETKKQIDADLAKGMSFADAAKKYSDDPTAPQGGDIGQWIGRGLLYDKTVNDKLFATPVGKMTEWFDIPAGFQRFEVYAKQEAKGPDFEKAKPALIEQITKEKGKDYKPTDTDIAQAYEKVKFRQILLKTKDEGSVDSEIKKLTEDATVTIYDPYILAYQALKGDKLQPATAMDFEALKKIASTAAVGQGYDFDLIKVKLDKGRPPQAAEPKSDAAATPEGAAKPGEPGADQAKAGDEAAKPAEDAKAEEGAKPGDLPKEISPEAPSGEPVPLYALAIGLVEKGIADKASEQQQYFDGHFMIGKLYMDWLQDDKNLKRQPVDRDKARKQVEENLAEAVKSHEYSALAYVLRGLNLAWMQQNDQARQQLEKAQTYAPQTFDPPGDTIWADLKKGYDVLGDQKKSKEIETLMTRLRQQAMQEQLQRMLQQQRQGGGPQGMPGGANIPIGSIPQGGQ